MIRYVVGGAYYIHDIVIITNFFAIFKTNAVGFINEHKLFLNTWDRGL